MAEIYFFCKPRVLLKKFEVLTPGRVANTPSDVTLLPKYHVGGAGKSVVQQADVLLLDVEVDR